MALRILHVHFTKNMALSTHIMCIRDHFSEPYGGMEKSNFSINISGPWSPISVALIDADDCNVPLLALLPNDNRLREYSKSCKKMTWSLLFLFEK